LITAKTVEGMRPGSVIVDLAAESGGNCELTEAGKEVEKHGVHILGFSDLPSTMATDASQLLARNIAALVGPFLKDGEVQLDLDDEVVQGALLTHAGEVRHEPTAKLLAGGASS
jgi:NAD(P) transhydrogenase subunit alpha